MLQLTMRFYAVRVLLCLMACLIAGCAVKTAVSSQSMADTEALPLPFSTSIHEGTLENGLTYYIKYNDMPLDKVELRLNVRSGSLNETEAERGIAHFVEHLAFNGTRNYKSNELIKFMERAGLTFGQHSNAYTSANNTNYMLSLPANDESLLEESFVILRDWADGLLFDPVEIEKEKGVIIEEWRTRNDVWYRLAMQSRQNLLAGSLYPVREPIGLVEVIRRADRDLLKGYYDKWYTSTNMAVIVVGNIEPSKAEALIRKHFTTMEERLSPAPADDTVPLTAGVRVKKISDPEATSTYITLTYFTTDKIVETFGDLKKEVLEAGAVSMLSKRVAADILEKKVDLIGFGAARSAIAPNLTAAQFTAVSAPERIEADLQAVLTEIERVKRYGFTKSELDEYITSQMTYLDRAARPDFKYPSADYASIITYYDTSGGYLTDFDQDRELYALIFAETTAEDYAEAFRTLLAGESALVTATLPEQYVAETALDEDLWRELEAQTARMELSPPEAHGTIDSLVASLPERGEIKSITPYDTLNGTLVEYTNGVKLFIKENSIDKNRFVMEAKKAGGLAVLNDKEAVRMELVPRLIEASGFADITRRELTGYMAGRQVRVSTRTTENTFNYTAEGNSEDIEVLFQLLYKYMTAPDADENAFTAIMDSTAIALANRERDKKTQFYRDAAAKMNNSAYRRTYLLSTDLPHITSAELLSLFEKYFTDGGNFVFVLSGDVDTDQVTELGRLYLASLPAPAVKAATKAAGVKLAKPYGTYEARGDSENKATISINLDKDVPRIENGQYHALLVSRIMQLRFRERIREELGATYGVGSNLWYVHWPEPSFFARISLTADPERKDEVIKEITAILNELAKNGITEQELTTAKTQQYLQLDSANEENRYWAGTLSQSLITGEELLSVQEKKAILETLTYKEVNDFVTTYLKDDRVFVSVYLPESPVNTTE